MTAELQREPEPELEPPVGSPQWEIQRAARAAIRQSDALDVVARERALAQVLPVALADSELRERMLGEARMNSGAVRLGPDLSGEAVVVGDHLMSVIRDRDGAIKQWRPGVFSSVVVRPHEWEEHDRRWRARVRLEENTLLAKYWGRDRCLMAGVISLDEAKELPPDPPRNPATTAPYDVAASVG